MLNLVPEYIDTIVYTTATILMDATANSGLLIHRFKRHF